MCPPHPTLGPQSWINDCAWSPSGRQLAFVSHDSSLTVVAFTAEATPPLVEVRLIALLDAP